MAWGVRSPVGETVGRRHHPAGVHKAAGAEAVPDVDGGQPGVGAGQCGRAAHDARPQEAPLLVPPAARLAPSGRGRGHRQGQQDIGECVLNSEEGSWGHRLLVTPPGLLLEPQAGSLPPAPPRPRQLVRKGVQGSNRLCPRGHRTANLSLSFPIFEGGESPTTGSWGSGWSCTPGRCACHSQQPGTPEPSPGGQTAGWLRGGPTAAAPAGPPTVRPADTSSLVAFPACFRPDRHHPQDLVPGLPLTPGANHRMALEQPSPREPQPPRLSDGQRFSRDGTGRGWGGLQGAALRPRREVGHQLHAPQGARRQYSHERAWSFST